MNRESSKQAGSWGRAIGQAWSFELARNLRRIKNCDLTSLLANESAGLSNIRLHALAMRAMPDRRFGGG